MIFSRFLSKKEKPSASADAPTRSHRTPKMPELDEFLLKRDYTGAISLLEFKLKNDRTNINTRLWLGHCYFRAGEYSNAANIYRNMLNMEGCPPEASTYLGCCLFYLGQYHDAKDNGENAIIETVFKPTSGTKGGLNNRLLFHVAHKLGDEKRLMFHHSQLQNDSLEDQLSLASIHFMRQHYNEAVQIYKGIVTDHINMIALNVYLAMCYFHLEYYEVAKEVLSTYLKSFPDSPAALNLMCAIMYRTYANNNTPATDLEKIPKSSLYPSIRAIIRHNGVIFRDGDGALQNLPAILDQVPEARINMINYYVKHQNEEGAFRMAEDLEPIKPIEFLLKALAYALMGLKSESKEHLGVAERFFKMVGEAAMEADTIPGRQSMAAHHFICGRYDEALFYYESIAQYMINDDNFFFNYGQILLMNNKNVEAEQALTSITPKAKERNLPGYKYFLAKALIRNGKADAVWGMIKQSEPQIGFTLTRILANDGFRTKAYFYSALAFDNLSRLDPSPDYHQGLLNCASGLFADFLKRKKPNVVQQMSILCRVLERSGLGDADRIAGVVKMYASKNGIDMPPPDMDFL